MGHVFDLLLFQWIVILNLKYEFNYQDYVGKAWQGHDHWPISKKTVIQLCMAFVFHSSALTHQGRSLPSSCSNRLSSSGPFYWQGLTLISAWISKHIQYKVWDEIIHLIPNSNGATVKVSEWTSYLISHYRIFQCLSERRQWLHC